MGGTSDSIADGEEEGAGDEQLPSPEDVREGREEWLDGGIGQEVGCDGPEGLRGGSLQVIGNGLGPKISMSTFSVGYSMVITGNAAVRMLASRATSSDVMAMVPMISNSCFCGFHSWSWR